MQSMNRECMWWENNIKVDLTEAECEAVTQLIWLRKDPVAGSREQDKKSLGFVLGGEIIN
jgi:hypothetical protein